MTRGLRIAPELVLPLDAITQAIAILARRGAGKTHTASVLVEEVVTARLPVVVLDPTGAWWGLRSSADGASAGLPVVILGGEHGDVPLEATAGKVIAELVVEHPGAYVVDLSGFESKAAEVRFATDFLERLYRAKATRRDAVLLVVDEADTFAPQRPGPDQTKLLGALEAIVRRGRIRGLGVVLISQRAAVLNKNVLTQCEVLVALQTTGPQDRNAIDEWIKGNGTAEERAEVLGSLASLHRGEAWVWSPSWLRTLVRIHIRPRDTFDSSKTPEAGERRIEPRAFAKVDLEQLGERIRATAEQAKANDPAELRRRIAQLESLGAAKPVDRVVEKIVEVPVLNGQLDDLRSVLDGLQEFGQWMATGANKIVAAADSIVTAIDRVASAPRPAPVIPAASRGNREPDQGRTGAPDAVALVARAVGTLDAPMETGEARRLDAGARRMLVALARLHPTPLLRSQLGTLADIAWTSGTFRGYLSSLRTAGLIEEPDRQTVTLSPAGVEQMAGELGTGAPSVAELVEMWNRKLDAGARRMLAILVDAHPEGVSRGELGTQAGIEATSGTFRGYLSKLRVNRLLDESGGIVRAGEALFLGGRR